MPEMNNFIGIPFRVDGWNSTPLLKDLNDAGFETQITMRQFNVGGADFFELALELAPYAFAALSAVLVAYAKKGRKVNINYKDGKVIGLQTTNCSVEEVTKLIQVVESIKQIGVAND